MARESEEEKSRDRNLLSGELAAPGGTYFDDTPFCLWLTIRGGRIRVAHPRKHQTRVSRQKSGGYPVATRRNQPRGIPPISFFLFSLAASLLSRFYLYRVSPIIRSVCSFRFDRWGFRGGKILQARRRATGLYYRFFFSARRTIGWKLFFSHFLRDVRCK